MSQVSSEGIILREYVEGNVEFNTRVPRVRGGGNLDYDNPVPPHKLGRCFTESDRRAVTGNPGLLKQMQEKCRNNPDNTSFMIAGPRLKLFFDPHRVKTAIVTTGGLAPGLNCVIHGIVKRHVKVYGILQDQGRVWGVLDSFKGLCDMVNYRVELTPEKTEDCLDTGGSMLGVVRHAIDMSKLVSQVSTSLRNNSIDILYVIGGDGSMHTAHHIAKANPNIAVVGIPKTMDNDILWAWRSFGFNTAVEQATRFINTLHSEARSTHRICLIELFGAKAGFVAAFSSLASGHVDAVLIPEVFSDLPDSEVFDYLRLIRAHIERTVHINDHSHALIVLAEGVWNVFHDRGLQILGESVTRENCAQLLLKYLTQPPISDRRNTEVPGFINQPRHNIRAVPPNPHDRLFCETLGELAVDSALAGYTNFMVSEWMGEYVMVPLELLNRDNGVQPRIMKRIPIKGRLWKQVLSITGQPLSSLER